MHGVIEQRHTILFRVSAQDNADIFLRAGDQILPLFNGHRRFLRGPERTVFAAQQPHKALGIAAVGTLGSIILHKAERII